MVGGARVIGPTGTKTNAVAAEDQAAVLVALNDRRPSTNSTASRPYSSKRKKASAPPESYLTRGVNPRLPAIRHPILVVAATGQGDVPSPSCLCPGIPSEKGIRRGSGLGGGGGGAVAFYPCHSCSAPRSTKLLCAFARRVIHLLLVCIRGWRPRTWTVGLLNTVLARNAASFWNWLRWWRRRWWCGLVAFITHA